MRRLRLTLLCAGSLVTAPPGAVIADASPAATHGCLPAGNGYLRARIRGAMNLDIDWHNAEIECDGGLRPDGSGLRVSERQVRRLLGKLKDQGDHGVIHGLSGRASNRKMSEADREQAVRILSQLENIRRLNKAAPAIKRFADGSRP